MRLNLIGVWVVSLFLYWTRSCVRSMKYEKLEQFEVISNPTTPTNSDKDEGYNHETPEVKPTTETKYVDIPEPEEQLNKDSTYVYGEEEEEKPKTAINVYGEEDAEREAELLKELNGDSDVSTEDHDDKEPTSETEADLQKHEHEGENQLEKVVEKEEDAHPEPVDEHEVVPEAEPEPKVESVDISHEKDHKHVAQSQHKKDEVLEHKTPSDLLDNAKTSSKRVYDTLLKEDEKADHLPNEHVEGDKKFPDYPLASHNRKFHSNGTHYSNKLAKPCHNDHSPSADGCDCDCDPTCTETEVVKTDGKNNPISISTHRTCHGAVPRGLKARKGKKKGKSKKKRKGRGKRKGKNKKKGKKSKKRKSKKRDESEEDVEDVGQGEDAIEMAKIAKKKAAKAAIKAKKAKAISEEAQLKAEAKEKRIKAELEAKLDKVEEEQAELDQGDDEESEVDKKKSKLKKRRKNKKKSKKLRECDSDFEVPKCSD